MLQMDFLVTPKGTTKYQKGDRNVFVAGVPTLLQETRVKFCIKTQGRWKYTAIQWAPDNEFRTIATIKIMELYFVLGNNRSEHEAGGVWKW